MPLGNGNHESHCETCRSATVKCFFAATGPDKAQKGTGAAWRPSSGDACSARAAWQRTVPKHPAPLETPQEGPGPTRKTGIPKRDLLKTAFLHKSMICISLHSKYLPSGRAPHYGINLFHLCPYCVDARRGVIKSRVPTHVRQASLPARQRVGRIAYGTLHLPRLCCGATLMMACIGSIELHIGRASKAGRLRQSKGARVTRLPKIPPGWIGLGRESVVQRRPPAMGHTGRNKYLPVQYARASYLPT